MVAKGIRELEDTVESLTATCAKLRGDVSDISKTVDELNDKVTKQQDTIRDLQTQNSRLEEHQNNLYSLVNLIADWLRHSFRNTWF